VTTDRSGFWIAMRLVVLTGAAYFAFATWTLGGKWLVNGSFLSACLAYASLCAFLLLPPRLIVRQWWAVSLALPFPVWWIAALAEEGVRGADLGGILLLHLPLLIQAGLVAHGRSAAVVSHSQRSCRGRTVQHS